MQDCFLIKNIYGTNRHKKPPDKMPAKQSLFIRTNVLIAEKCKYEKFVRVNLQKKFRGI